MAEKQIMIFYLGIHRPLWMELTDIPLFVSHNVLRNKRNLPRAKGRWSLDSGAFTEISTHGKWTIKPIRYLVRARRFRDEIGKMDWAAIQDWMCEPWILKKTGLTVKKHQSLTVDSFVELSSRDSSIPWIPILQGWNPNDYSRHREMYEKRKIDLSKHVVGIGSVCRRNLGQEIRHIVSNHADLKLHGFGIKVAEISTKFFSTDSMAWSYGARFKEPLPGHNHSSCANCLEYALMWRNKIVSEIAMEEMMIRKGFIDDE